MPVRRGGGGRSPSGAGKGWGQGAGTLPTSAVVFVWRRRWRCGGVAQVTGSSCVNITFTEFAFRDMGKSLVKIIDGQMNMIVCILIISSPQL